MERMAALSRRLLPLTPRRIRRVPQAAAAEARVARLNQ